MMLVGVVLGVWGLAVGRTSVAGIIAFLLGLVVVVRGILGYPEE